MDEAADKPPKLWREELRRAWREMRGSDSTAARAGFAVAMGVFIGSQPIFGCHTPLVIGLCMVLQLDALLAFVASNISNPFFAPFLLTAEVQVGGYLHTGKVLNFSPEMAADTGLSGFVVYAFSGAPLVGLVLATTGFAVVFVGVSLKRRFWPATERQPYRLPAHAPAWWHAVESVAQRYAPRSGTPTPVEQTRFHYVRTKMLGDPVGKMIADLFGDKAEVLGDVLDIGTGRGQMAVAVAGARTSTAC